MWGRERDRGSIRSLFSCAKTGERWLRDHPEASAKMMDLLTTVVVDYMAAQVHTQWFDWKLVLKLRVPLLR